MRSTAAQAWPGPLDRLSCGSAAGFGHSKVIVDGNPLPHPPGGWRTFGLRGSSRCACGGAGQGVAQRTDGNLEHRQIRDGRGEWIGYGSLDNKAIVDRTFKACVLENRYLKVTLVPEFGGRILSIIYKPTGHEQLYRTEVGVPYGIKGGTFLLRLDDGVWRHLSDLPGCRARQDLAEAVGF